MLAFVRESLVEACGFHRYGRQRDPDDDSLVDCLAKYFKSSTMESNFVSPSQATRQRHSAECEFDDESRAAFNAVGGVA